MVSARRSEEGFALIELLVVMIIIGLLAAVAIPTYLNQRRKAIDASMASDLRVIAYAEEAHLLRTDSYLTTTNVVADLNVTLSPGNVGEVAVSPTTPDVFCVKVTRAPGGIQGSAPARIYLSHEGGVQPTDVQVCP